MDVALLVDSLSPRMSGIGRYCWELCQRIPLEEEVSKVHYYRDCGFIRRPETLLYEREGLGPRRWPRVWPRRWSRAASRTRLNKMLVHSPNYFLPKEVDWGVITVHDLSVFKYPETHPSKRVAHFAQDFAHSVARAAYIITDTETVREEVIDYLGVDPSKVGAVPLASDSSYRPYAEEIAQPFLEALGLRYGAYGLTVSTLEPRKRVDALIRVWSRLPKALRDNYPLVLAGAMGWLSEGLSTLIEQGEAAGWLRPLGFVPEQSLPLLYAGAGLFAYPSVYEGFGLPLLEAMASGVPVIASSRSCMPEVGGNAPLYVDPDNEDAFLFAIERGLSDGTWREIARERGINRAAQFSWERCAAQTAGIYRTVWETRR